MSQNDMVIANANGATVRADINSALQALASSNGGATAPSTTYANQFWFDTVNDQMKIRDEANANWVVIASLVGTTWVPFSNGSVLGTLANLNASSISTALAMAANIPVSFSLTSISSGTPNFASSGNVTSLSGTATANTLGTTQAGFVGFIHYAVGVTVTHNATSRILPTGANIAFVAGDVEIVLSLGSGNYRTIGVMRASGAALVGAQSASSQAQQEAATDNTTFVTPLVQKFHPSAAKGWANFTEVTTTAITASYNVSSLTDNAVGDTSLNWTTAFSTASAYTFAGGVMANATEASGGTLRMDNNAAANMSTTLLRVNTQGNTSTKYDSALATVTCFGDQ